MRKPSKYKLGSHMSVLFVVLMYAMGSIVYYPICDNILDPNGSNPLYVRMDYSGFIYFWAPVLLLLLLALMKALLEPKISKLQMIVGSSSILLIAVLNWAYCTVIGGLYA
jgi:uncharacterized membrane protein YcaP (DUF421 family)